MKHFLTGLVVLGLSWSSSFSLSSVGIEAVADPGRAELPDKLKLELQPAALVAKAIAPSLVRVEYMLQYDKGQIPRGLSWGERCPNCGQIHGSNLDEFVRDERPLETVGFLLSPTTVVTEDIETHPRFIKSVSVRFGEQLVAVQMRSYVKDNNAVLLELTEPLKEAK